MTLADVLRLVAVPVLGWAAYRDVKTRRVPTRTWYPLVALGAVLLVWEVWGIYLGDAPAPAFQRRLFPIRVAASLGIVAPFAYLVWRMGGFGGADAKAIMALAVLFPTYPTYVVHAVPGSPLVVPVQRTLVGVFSLSILTNTVVLGAAYPLALTLRNLLAGDLSPVVPFGRPVPAASVVERHGSLLETPEGYTRRGLDVDALRMYLRWRGASLADLRADPERFRDPASVPDERNDPGDGAVTADGSGAAPDLQAPVSVADDDAWGAAAFLEDLGWGAYGTDPEDLRGGLEVLVERDEVWYSPGIPFIVPMFAGLVVALAYGDLLFAVLQWLGLV